MANSSQLDPSFETMRVAGGKDSVALGQITRVRTTAGELQLVVPFYPYSNPSHPEQHAGDARFIFSTLRDGSTFRESSVVLLKALSARPTGQNGLSLQITYGYVFVREPDGRWQERFK